MHTFNRLTLKYCLFSYSSVVHVQLEHCLNNIRKFLSPDSDKIISTPNTTSV